MSTESDLQKLGDYLGQFTTSLSPVKEPSKWIAANIDSIQSLWTDIFSTPNDTFPQLGKPMYPRLLAYTLGHLKFYADGNLYLDLKEQLAQWENSDVIPLLRCHRSIKETLWAFQNRCRNNRSGDVAFTGGNRVNKLLRLDVLSIAAQILVMVNHDQLKKMFFDQQGPHAQTLLDLLQDILDIPGLDPVRPPILRVLLELSRRSGLYPTSLILHDVHPRGQESVTAGSYGDIWEGTWAGTAIAIKVMKIDSPSTNRIRVFCKEAIVWRQLHQTNVLPFLGVCQWPSAPLRICLVSPWMEHGNIVKYLHENPDADRLPLIIDIAQGLHYLHNFDPPVIHGDLRGTNILVTAERRACIADFGLCTLAQDSCLNFTPNSSAYQCTNLLWLAPEFFEYDEDGQEVPHQSCASDIYSFGCICYEMFAGSPRFSEKRVPFEIAIAVAKDIRPNRPVHEALDDRMWKLMDMCWCKTPSSRPTAHDVVQYLSPPIDYDQRSSDVDMFSLPPNMLKKSIMFQDIIIALVGPTGSGKSRFINTATKQSSVVVGDDLDSCTQDVQAISYPHPDGSARNIIFVDTPGFDDTEKTDFQVLEQVANWLKATYEEEITLTGLLFFHRITDARMRGTPLRNLTMLEALCGKDALENIVLTTTMWDQVHPVVGTVRERQLHDVFWKPLMGGVSRTARFYNTFESAWDIINVFDINTPRPLLVQKEMRDEKKNLRDTSAFRTLVRWWEQLVSNFRDKFRRRK